MEKNELEVEEIDEIVETKDEDDNDTTDWKALALKNQGIAKRFKTKFEKAKEVKVDADEPKEPEKEGFDYAELAYLTAKGISDEDVSFVEETAKNTGKQLKDLLGTKWFQAELQERKEERITKDAVPGGSRRSNSSSKDNMDYWRTQIDAGKAKLSDIEDVALRREVLNARIKTDENKSKFASDSVIMSGQG